MKLLFSFLTLLIVGCGEGSVFHRIGGTHYSPPSIIDAQELSITNRSILCKCDGELIGTLSGVDPYITPYVVARKGGTHYITIGNVQEVWVANSVCVKRLQH